MVVQGRGESPGRLASYLGRLNPVPAFPQYSGPHKVGTVDVEIPVSDLESPSAAPDGTAAIHTIQFRIFYPATPDSAGKKISWLPAPQRQHITAYTTFMGIAPLLAEVVSFLPRHLHYATLPVHKNAALLEPDTSDKRWPTMVFSHGLAGFRNAYSYFAGSMASHGVVVICPEHRDGSSVVSFIRDPARQDAFFRRNRGSVVPYVRIPHTETPEIWAARNAQLRIRLWELGLLHDAILRLDELPDLANLNISTPKDALMQFRGKLGVQESGSIIWAGHSFGAATIVQFIKSVYYADEPSVAAMAEPLFRPATGSRLKDAITEKNPVILQDMWCFPLLAESTRALWSLPLPAYADVATAPGGKALLAVESESFFKWTKHLHATARVLSPDPAAPCVLASAFGRPSGLKLPEPSVFYVEQSAHLNQSDFGVLFPWLTGKMFGVKDPEQALRLNLRAALQMLRTNNVAVARTSFSDLVDGEVVDKTAARGPHHDGVADDGVLDDEAILDRRETTGIRSWKWIDIIGLGSEMGSLEQGQREDETRVSADETDEEQEMESELEPQLSRPGKVDGTTPILTNTA